MEELTTPVQARKNLIEIINKKLSSNKRYELRWVGYGTTEINGPNHEGSVRVMDLESTAPKNWVGAPLDMTFAEFQKLAEEIGWEKNNNPKSFSRPRTQS